MPGNQMTPQGIGHPEGGLQVYRVTLFGYRQGRSLQGLGGYFHGEIGPGHSDHGQAYSIHGHTVSDLKQAKVQLSGNGQPDPTARSFNSLDLPHILDQTGEHINLTPRSAIWKKQVVTPSA
jgi:hypothetical protein